MSDTDMYEERHFENEYEQLSDRTVYENDSTAACTDAEPEQSEIEDGYSNHSSHPHHRHQSHCSTPGSIAIRMDSNYAVSTKEMPTPLRYHFTRYNILGWALNCLAFLYYSLRFGIYKVQMDGHFGVTDCVEMRAHFRPQYLGGMVYFLLAILYPTYIHEQHNSEAPILLTTAFQVSDAYIRLSGAQEQPVSLDWFDLWGGVLVCLICLLRRKPVLRILLNPYSKDQTGHDCQSTIAG